MNIICPKCEIPYLPEKNGIIVEEMAGFDPYKLWSADLLKCPKCGGEIIAGFGNQPLCIHSDPDYKAIRKKWAKTQDRIYRFY